MLNKIKTFFNNKLNLAITIVLLCAITGIIGSSVLIDNYLHTSLASEREVSLNVDVEVINKTDDTVTIEEENDKIKIHVDANKNSNTSKNINVGYIIPEVGVNVRTEPDINSDIIATLKYNSKVKVKGEESGWYKTDIGYIRKDLINLSYIN